ncbi:UDP-N-acetylenolpyruvoylglucosamine reductase [Alphaproteobacteria bacterium]|nr:UDP-N-acetylenolpyruvoylglucosamine reductase [Alphaproteobacteria bacterium]
MQRELWKNSEEFVENFSLKELSFFKVGGNCDLFFSPKNVENLSLFLREFDGNVLCLGNISNTLISDDGIDGCVINLMNSFDKVRFFNDFVIVDAGVLLSNFIKICIKNGVSCLEQLFCIPGTIGGAVCMNAGTPSFDISKNFVSADCVDIRSGDIISIQKEELKMGYRSGNIPKNLIIISAKFKIYNESPSVLNDITKEIFRARLASQPINEKTCGSTFKNPKGMRAWQLIKETNCDKLSVGGAVVSQKHCNFLINSGDATAKDFIKLIDIMKEKVFENSCIMLEEEIKIIGRNL